VTVAVWTCRSVVAATLEIRKLGDGLLDHDLEGVGLDLAEVVIEACTSKPSEAVSPLVADHHVDVPAISR